MTSSTTESLQTYIKECISICDWNSCLFYIDKLVCCCIVWFETVQMSMDRSIESIELYTEIMMHCSEYFRLYSFLNSYDFDLLLSILDLACVLLQQRIPNGSIFVVSVWYLFESRIDVQLEMNEREKCKSLLDSFLSVVVDLVSPYSFSIARLYCLKGKLCESEENSSEAIER